MNQPTTTDFGQLRAFIAGAEALNFSRAAENLGGSSAALSQLVRSLEERVGVRLLNRNTRNVSLTEAGDRLLQRVKPAVEELGAAIGQTSNLSEHPIGPVRFHCFRTAAELYVRPILKSFHAAYPDVVLDITVDDEVVDLVAGRFEAAIRIGEVIEKDMVAMRLGPDLRQIAVASPDYLARRGSPQHPRDLLSHDCIGWRWPEHERPYKWEFQEKNQKKKNADTKPNKANSKEFCLQAALDGLGIAFPTEQLCVFFVAAGRLVWFFVLWFVVFS